MIHSKHKFDLYLSKAFEIKDCVNILTFFENCDWDVIYLNRNIRSIGDDDFLGIIYMVRSRTNLQFVCFTSRPKKREWSLIDDKQLKWFGGLEARVKLGIHE